MGKMSEELLKQAVSKIAPKNVDEKIILRAYEILSSIRDGTEGHGITLVLGFDPLLHHRTVMDMTDDIFEDGKEHINDPHMKDKIQDNREIDGAMLLDKNGKMVHSGMFFVANPRYVLRKMGLERDGSLPENFGFSKPVGTRHICSIGASWKMKDSFVFVLSENREVRLFHNGMIAYSDYPEEINWEPKEASNDDEE
ncbi:MAG: hypothetical protein ABIB71_05505 [Candidatus Woesearchaeota archaeon]